MLTQLDVLVVDITCTFLLCLIALLIFLAGIIFVGYIVKEVCDIVVQWKEDSNVSD